MVNKPTDIEVSPLDTTEETEAGGETAYDNEQDLLVAGAVVEATAKILGKALVLFTKMPDMDFTPEEVEALKNLWTPLLPTMSPVMAAVVGTVVIVGGKFALYMVKKGEANAQTS